MSRTRRMVLCAGLTVMAAGVAHASSEADPVAPLLLSLSIVLLSAKLGGHVAARAGQPPVLGELLSGVVLGNLTLVGVEAFAGLPGDRTLDLLARLGVVILLFEVGLESTVREMMKVGVSSLMVALVGVAAPFMLGWGAGAWLLPERGALVHAFLGATLTATSIGITARVLQDLGRSRSTEARIILGAAVIDDVLGLVILSVVSGAVAGSATGQAMTATDIGIIVGKAAGFLAGALLLGTVLSPPLFTIASRLEGGGVLLSASLSFCFLLAFAASKVGLAPLVGAYAAGLVLERVHFQRFSDRGEHELEDLVKPIGTLLVPVFFVLMGMHVNIAALARREVLGLACVLTVAAWLGKMACALVAPRDVNRLAIGCGMAPRGEVGLIFAAVGRQLTLSERPLLDDALFSAIVMMVILTTLATPPALKWSLSRRPAVGPATPVE